MAKDLISDDHTKRNMLCMEHFVLFIHLQPICPLLIFSVLGERKRVTGFSIENIESVEGTAPMNGRRSKTRV